jgi:hypothetical protein
MYFQGRVNDSGVFHQMCADKAAESASTGCCVI